MANYILNASVIPRESVKATTMIVNNTTGSVTMYTLTGTVVLLELWGEVTTVISANHTAGFVELYDATASPDVTLNTGITLSALLAGTMVTRFGLAGAALTLKNNAAGTIQDPTTLQTSVFTPIILQKKTAATTILRYTYSTTDAPSSGVITWHAVWRPLSGDGNLA